MTSLHILKNLDRLGIKRSLKQNLQFRSKDVGSVTSTSLFSG